MSGCSIIGGCICVCVCVCERDRVERLCEEKVFEAGEEGGKKEKEGRVRGRGAVGWGT